MGSGYSRLHRVRYVITFGGDDWIMVPATTPSLEMALEVARVVCEQLPKLRPELESPKVRVWRYAEVQGHVRPAPADLIALFDEGAGC